jgi:site-specific recombinase XerD
VRLAARRGSAGYGSRSGSGARVHRLGLRDRALLTLLYNTGAPATEVAQLNIKDLRLQAPGQVRILGKGRKERICPLWQETPDALRGYLRQRADGAQPDAPLFLNAHGERITRSGAGTILKRNVTAAAATLPSPAAKPASPHTLRRTTALHLLQSGAGLNVIKSWPGHLSITTTSEYTEIGMAMKRKAIERRAPPAPGPEAESRWHAGKDIIQWLEDP